MPTVYTAYTMASSGTFTCNICYDDCRLHTKRILSKCSHECCFTCLKKLLEQKNQIYNCHATCPFCRCKIDDNDLYRNDGYCYYHSNSLILLDLIHERNQLCRQNQQRRKQRQKRREMKLHCRQRQDIVLDLQEEKLKARRKTQITEDAPPILFF